LVNKGTYIGGYNKRSMKTKSPGYPFIGALLGVVDAPGEPYIQKDVPMYDKNGCTTLGTIAGYCMKCKMKTVMYAKKRVYMKNGRAALNGLCTICDTEMFRIGRY